MAPRPGPNLLRLQLGKELRRLREGAGRKVSDVAEILGWSDSKLSRIETADTTVRSADFEKLLDLYGIQGERRQALLATLGQSRQKAWWEAYGSVLPGAYESFIGFEAEASKIFNYSAMLVPGLLQTAEYAKSVTQVVLAGEREDLIDQRVRIRMARQSLLAKEPPLSIWTIIDEAVLHRPIGGPEIMRRQMLRLLEVSSQSTITIRILPFAVGAHRGIDGTFSILQFPENHYQPIVYCEGMTGGVIRERADELRKYWMSFEAISAVALSPEESAKMISTTAGIAL